MYKLANSIWKILLPLSSYVAGNSEICLRQEDVVVLAVQFYLQPRSGQKNKWIKRHSNFIHISVPFCQLC